MFLNMLSRISYCDRASLANVWEFILRKIYTYSLSILIQFFLEWLITQNYSIYIMLYQVLRLHKTE